VVPIHSEVTFWEFRLRICDPSPTYSPPATSGTAVDLQLVWPLVQIRFPYHFSEPGKDPRRNRQFPQRRGELSLQDLFPCVRFRAYYTGGNMDRPALKRLLAAVEARTVDVWLPMCWEGLRSRARICRTRVEFIALAFPNIRCI
jgi:hypothetical protein